MAHTGLLPDRNRIDRSAIRAGWSHARQDAYRDADADFAPSPINPAGPGMAEWRVANETSAVAGWQAEYVKACQGIGAANRRAAEMIRLGHCKPRGTLPGQTLTIRQLRAATIGPAFRKLAMVRRALAAAEARLADALSAPPVSIPLAA